MTDIRIPGVKYGAGSTYDEREALEKGASNDVILNGAARKAGYLKPDETVRISVGDRTYDETVAEQQAKLGMNVDTASNTVDAIEKGVELGCFAKGTLAAEAFADLAGIAVFPVTAYSLMRTLPQSWGEGDVRNEAAHKDMLHVALLKSLSLPDGYCTGELSKRREAAAGPASPITNILHQIDHQPGAKLILQVRCDEGMKAAEQLAQSGKSLDAFLKANEGFARRFTNDLAFRAGFDAMVWARKEGPEELTKALTDLNARDARTHGSSNFVWTA